MNMKMSEIYALEEANKSSIYLYLEGSFYKAYERSAFRFCKRFRECKVSAVHNLSLACDIVRIGFPKIALDKYMAVAQSFGYSVECQDEKRIAVHGIEPLEGFSSWKNGCVSNAVRAKEQTLPIVNAQESLKLRLYREAYDNAVALTNFTSRLHRNFRFGAGDSLRNESLELAVKLHVAFKRGESLDERQIFYEIEQMRIRTRIMHDVKQFDSGVWKMLNDRFDKMQNLLRSESCCFDVQE